MDAVLIIFLGIILMSVRSSDNLQLGALSKSSTDNLKGISIGFIMMHHLSQLLVAPTGANFWFSRLTIVGELGVAIFFFVSGYGIMRQEMVKGEKYLENFFSHRVLPIIMVYTGTMVIVFLIKRWLFNLTLYGAIYTIRIGTPFVNNSWFIFAIVLAYIAFWLAKKIAKSNDWLFFGLLLLFSIAYIQATRHLGFGPWWYDDIQVFVLGIVIGRYNDLVFRIINRNYRLVGYAILGVYAGCVYLEGRMASNMVIMAGQLAFVALVVVITARVEVKNKILMRMSRDSIVLYLVHGLFISVLRAYRTSFLQSDVRFGMLVLTLSFATAVAYDGICTAIQRLKRQRLTRLATE